MYEVEMLLLKVDLDRCNFFSIFIAFLPMQAESVLSPLAAIFKDSALYGLNPYCYWRVLLLFLLFVNTLQP